MEMTWVGDRTRVSVSSSLLGQDWTGRWTVDEEGPEGGRRGEGGGDEHEGGEGGEVAQVTKVEVVIGARVVSVVSGWLSFRKYWVMRPRLLMMSDLASCWNDLGAVWLVHGSLMWWPSDVKMRAMILWSTLMLMVLPNKAV